MPVGAPAAVHSPAFFAAVVPLSRSDHKPFDGHHTDAVRLRLLRKGVAPTPKILHALRKKETQKTLRRSKKQNIRQSPPPLSDAQRQALEEDAFFRTATAEYRAVREELRCRGERAAAAELSGKPWEGSKGVDLRGILNAREETGEGRLKGEHLEELKEVLAERNGERFRWLLDDDVEEMERVEDERERRPAKLKRLITDEEKIRLLVERLHSTNLNMQDWKFSRLMKQFDLFFTEMALLKIVGRLGTLGNWRQALSIVEWVYNQKDYKHRKSRFVYTKLLAILGKARRPEEALQVFNKMREVGQLYPDMAAYHSVAVTLGQAGLVNELVVVIEHMKQTPSKEVRRMKRRDWDPCLQPDVIIYNAVLNACIPSHQWRGVFWVLEQMRKSNLKPTGATYGLAMEVMLRAGKHEFVHRFFEKMRTSGLAPKALTYRVLVKSFWEEGKVNEAVAAVRNMEQRGVVGAASVYYELACCLCNNGRWQDAMLEIGKLKNLSLTKPLEVAFTGMILSSLDGGHINDCISMFEHMKDYCTPNIGTINAMLKVYNSEDMFASAKNLFEATKAASSNLRINTEGYLRLQPDAYSYHYMLEASASAQQWEYFEYVYKEMALCGYRLDQRKHGSLLVEASRAGKWHLLEHAFDRIVEADEVPHASLFAALICQMIAHQNYERTASLLNGMAHASLKFSESQWMNFLQKDMDRFIKDNLQDLLNHLENSNLVMEEPVPNFLKVLERLCGGARLLKGTFSCEDRDLESCSALHGYLPAEVSHENDDRLIPNFGPKLFATTDISSNIDVSMQETVNSVASSLAVGIKPDTLDLMQHRNLGTSVTDEAMDSATVPICTPYSEKRPPASEILKKWRQDRI